MDLRWILMIIALLSVRDTFCETFASVPSASVAPSEVDCQPYVEKAIKELVTSEPIGSTGHDNTVRQNESPASGSTPNDDVTSSSSQDGNPSDDIGPASPAESEKSEEKKGTTGEEMNLSESVGAINENNGNTIIVEVEEENPDQIITAGDGTNKIEDDDNEVEVVNEEDDETPKKSSVESVENKITEPEKETISIILDENLVKDNAKIIIDVEDVRNKNYQQKPNSVTEMKIEEKIEVTRMTVNAETPVKQAFKGTRKRNPKYWKFDPDEEEATPDGTNEVKPETTGKTSEQGKTQVFKGTKKRNPKYWKFDPDEFPLEQPSSKPAAEPPKRRNPKYWKLDPEEEKLYAEASKVEEIKTVLTKRKRNPKYWKFDPDEEEAAPDGTNEVKKPETTGKTSEQGKTQVFKGTKKRNPKYWKFDPDEFEDQEEIKKEPEKKRKRNPKYWKFDPDEDLDEIQKPLEEVIVKQNEYRKTDEPTEKIEIKPEDEPKKNKYWYKKEEAEDVKVKELTKREEPATKKNKYWKIEETEEQKEVVKEDEMKTKKYSKTEKPPVLDPVQDKLAETQRSMYWKLDDAEQSSKTGKRDEKVKMTRDEVDVEEYQYEEDLTMDEAMPKNLRNKSHIKQTLKIGENTAQHDEFLSKIVDATLKELKKVYEVAIKPLEMTFKYRDLSNRHFGEPEIFSKPLVLFMGPWSGGKSSIINYLLDIEYSQFALRTGAEPSPAYFNIMMYNNREAILDGTQLAADWTFSGLQKFGQGLLDKLRGLKLPHPLLEKVNIVEIPGILEMRKHVDRVFPFNDVCQWFIDRADAIFLVYDPAKLDVGPETEAILDQLKGREYQTRILLNKADKIRAEELMRVQGSLIWNISPLMSSAEPPIIYSVSLWSNPYEIGSPAKLLHSQELSFLRDIRSAIDRRVENKIASARRFAVRVRNHAKMVDCYLTTYYNHKTFFGNKKTISDDIIENPQNYHIYEGLSTLTNISRYDLPDPDVYRDFFRLNPVYEFKKLSETCTYFRGCPINKLDMAIAYDLPDLIGQYKRQEEELVVNVP